MQFERKGMDANMNNSFNPKRNIFKPVVAFFLVLIVLFSLMLMVNAVPRAALQNGLNSSAEYYSSYAIRHNWVENLEQSKEDIYADAVLMNMIACMEPGIEGTVSARYYEVNQYMGQNLLDVMNDAEANENYSRYWHGTMIPVTLMLLLTDADGIRLINAVILAALVIAFLCVCIKRKQYALGIGYLVAFIITQSFFVPLSIEYMSCYVISILASILVLSISKDKLIYVFLLTGLCTAFFDFLTVETMTVLLPLVAWIAIARKEKTTDEIFTSVGKYGALWLAGYGGAFVCKWILSFALLGSTALAEVATMGGEKLIEDIPVNVSLGRFGTAIFHNLAGLVPTTFTSTYTGITSVLFIAALMLFSFWFLFRGKTLDKRLAIALVFVAVVPYARYLMLPYHAYVHSFFTYRAQLSTLVAIFLLVAWTIEPPRLRPKRR